MLAAPDQPRDDLCDTTLLALVWISHQSLHVRPQQREKGITEIAKQSLKEWGKDTLIYFFICQLWSACINDLNLRNLTLNKQNLRGLNLSLPLRSSRERNSMNWLMNTGSMKWSKMICSLCENIKSIFNIVVNILHFHICFVYSHSAHTSVISSLSRFCLGCSSGGAYINSFLETKHEVTVNKFHVKDVVGEMKTNR